jgi:hypothetical protein
MQTQPKEAAIAEQPLLSVGRAVLCPPHVREPTTARGLQPASTLIAVEHKKSEFAFDFHIEAA